MENSEAKLRTLSLEDAPKVLFLFGLPGAGKTYIGELIARHSNFYHYNADTDFTPRMLDAIEQKEEFSDAMRDEFYRLVAERLPELVSQHGRVIVSQAAFRKRHRKMIQERSVDLEFVWVKAPEELLIERLISRGNEVTPDYLKQVAPNFEVAEGNPRVLVNDSDDENILKYFKEWYR